LFASKSAIIILLALFTSSCRTTRESSYTALRDSLNWQKSITVIPVTIPASLASLTIPLDSLRKLPFDAGYISRSSHATASVKFRNDTIYVYAAADSIQQLTYKLTEQLSRNSSMTANKDKTTTPVPAITSITTKAKWYLAGIITGFIVLVIILIYKKYGTHSR